MARRSNDEIAPFIPWSEFVEKFRWKQGEHMTLVGPTGQGKTTLALDLINRFRTYVVVFATKAKDPLISDLRGKGYVIRSEWEGNPDLAEKVILRPPLTKGKKSLPDQRRVFEHALFTVFKQGNWCVYLDEARYITDTLKLSEDCELIWQQGRSLGATMVASTQRPVKIPLVAYDQATHLFFWRENDEANLRRIGGLGGVSNRDIIEVVSMLGWHEVMYLNSRTGEMVRTKVEV